MRKAASVKVNLKFLGHAVGLKLLGTTVFLFSFESVLLVVRKELS